MEDREHILHSLHSYILENYEGPFEYQIRWASREYFFEKSYAKWAAHEFLEYLSTHPGDPFKVAENYISSVGEKFRSSDTLEKDRVFRAAFSVADDLLDFMRALK